MVKSVLAPGVTAVLTFEDRNYRDLGDFALKLARRTEFSAYTAVSAAALALYDHLQGRGSDAAVLRVAYRPQYQGATGLSVFLPPNWATCLASTNSSSSRRPPAGTSY